MGTTVRVNMNRAKRRSYIKLHKNNPYATYCKYCDMKTLNRLVPFNSDDTKMEYACEVCGNIKSIAIDLTDRKDATTHISIYKETI